ncbi:hypothetical protein HR45_13755 [Shewanella mangrovi]|uniref:Glycosyl transferase family 11 n=1 Tax=Shewanella mangrovi TaxID=1515746 RepID=A0A094JFT7_9GAMM|nr:alpha-1,2-fucosyltransferase [Shewanella mangrovi]KFZ36864.1 hypothetical protein HR45_13755 [Shewanella mangrovi]
MKSRVILNGGLGNQLFQLTHALYLHERTRSDIIVDTSIVDSSFFQSKILKQTIVDFELDKLKTIDGVVFKSSIFTLFLIVFHKLLKKISFSKVCIFSTDFGKGILPFYFGYFQNMNTARSYSKMISFRSEFIDNKNYLLMNEIKNNLGLCLHVRRGDYLSANSYYAVCSSSYYKRVLERSTLNKVYVFSNDIVWCKESGIFPQDTVFVDHNNGDKSYLDLLLISCGENICVANSTFSIWAALLSSATDVFYPVRYYTDDERNLSLSDWTSVEN